MEKGKRTTYLQLKSVCFYEKQTPLQYLHARSIFFPFIFLSCIKKGSVCNEKAFHYNIDDDNGNEK